MSFFDFFNNQDINKGLDKFSKTSNAVLLDVRTKDEYNLGHIKGSINIPLSDINSVANYISNKDTHIFVYCHSGARSSQAVEDLKEICYTNIENIGGIMNYKGTVVK